MEIFEWTLTLLVAATVLTAVARRLGAPYPSMLALLGVGLVFVPSSPKFVLQPELALALFVAPVLLDSAFDSSLRDLKQNWRPITALVVMAVGGTIAAVAGSARYLMPQMPWAAAIALGAIVAPPDAAAAMAVLRQVPLPNRLLQILEGESLLNDATALLIYRVAVAAAVTGSSISASSAVPLFLFTVLGSVALAFVVSLLTSRILTRVEDVPTSVVLQFAMTFVVWILAERLHLSGILTLVSYALVISRSSGVRLPARMRVPSYAVWEFAVFILNALAFVMIGLQLGPILERVAPADRLAYGRFAGAMLAVTIGFRVVWVFTYDWQRRLALKHRRQAPDVPTLKEAYKSSLVTAWCGMRGIVTLAAALALPEEFPQRDLVVLSAYVVVLGTLLLQGLTLKPLLKWLALPDDGVVERELVLARHETRKTVMSGLGDDQSQAAQLLRFEYTELELSERRGTTSMGVVRRASIERARDSLEGLRRDGKIGDQAYQQIEAELDRAELFAESNL